MLSPHQTLRYALPLLALATALQTHADPTASLRSDHTQKLGLHKLFLHCVSPNYVIQQFGWHNALDSKADFQPSNGAETDLSPALPDGVDRLYAMDGDNSLLVFSTDGGFKSVGAFVARVDTPQRQRRLSIRVSVIEVKNNDLDETGINLGVVPLTEDSLLHQAAAGDGTPHHLFSLFAGGMLASQLYGKIVKATKNRPTTVSLQGAEDDPMYFSDGALLGMQMTPCINADNTVTLTLNPPPSGPVQEDVHGFRVPAQPLTIKRTVYTGETMMVSSAIESHGSQFRSVQTNDTTLLMFITPTVLNAKTASSGTP